MLRSSFFKTLIVLFFICLCLKQSKSFAFRYTFVAHNLKNFTKNNENFKETTQVICAAENKNWLWLPNTTVQGHWRELNINLGFDPYTGIISITKNSPNMHKTNKNIHIIYDYFFILQDGLKKYKELKQQCITFLGSEYKYVQPANSNLSGWYVFAIDDILQPGINYSVCIWKFPFNTVINRPDCDTTPKAYDLKKYQTLY